MKRKRIILFAGVLLALPLVLEILYVVAANAVIRSGVIERAISVPPENVNIAWDSAYTVWPGLVHVSGFRLRVQDPVTQFVLTIDDARVEIVLPELLHKQFRASHVTAEGVGFRFLAKVDSTEAQSRRVDAFPPIDGFPRPAVRPVPMPPPPTAALLDKLLHVQLDDVDATVKELWVMEYRFEGSGHLRGGFGLQPLRNLWVGPAELTLQGGALTAGDHMISPEFKARLAVTIAPVDLQASPGLLLLRALTTSIEFHTPIEDLTVAGLYVDGLKTKGAAKLTVDVAIDKGKLLAGSVAEAWLSGTDAQVDGYHFTGEAHAKLSVAVDAPQPTVQATLSGTVGGLMLEKEPQSAELSDVTAELVFEDNDLSRVPTYRWLHAAVGELRVPEVRQITQLVAKVVPLIAPMVLGDGPLYASATAYMTPAYTLVRLKHLKLGDAELEGSALPGVNGWTGVAAGHFGKIPLGIRLHDSKLESVLFPPKPWFDAELHKAGIDPERVSAAN